MENERVQVRILVFFSVFFFFSYVWKGLFIFCIESQRVVVVFPFS